MNKNPIGMFDSGFGGLTVAKAVIDLLPDEDIIYLGDSARYPYGSKPQIEVLSYSMEIADYLINVRGARVLVVACNTATAAALEQLRESFPVPIIGVIEPGLRALVELSTKNKVGVIGTVGSVESGAYEKSMADIAPHINVRSYACPGFVEFVERGQLAGHEVHILAERLLAPVMVDGVDSLLLGCTHYPYLTKVIADVLGDEITLVSSADQTALALAEILSLETGFDSQKLEAAKNDSRSGLHEFVSSGDVAEFSKIGARLFGPELKNVTRWKPS